MKDQPILFSGPMVRAILEGRKTQTRRVASHPLAKSARVILGPNREGYFDCIQHDETGGGILCPYGAPGHRLWVRETWQAWRYCSMEYDEWDVCDCAPSEIRERYGNPKLEYAATSDSGGPWRPSIHMPRWASRITLEIEAVRVERLQDISEEGAKAEGVKLGEDRSYSFAEHGLKYEPHKLAFQTLWNSINGPGSWDANPFVWVITFKRIQNLNKP